MRTVRLRQLMYKDRSFVAFVDDEDYELISKHRWFVRKPGLYAYANINGRAQYMHRFIARPTGRLEIHHVDENALNNVRKNLRVLSSPQHARLHKNWHKHD